MTDDRHATAIGRFTRRQFLRTAGLAAAGVALGACKSPSTSQSKSGKVQLVYQDWRTDWFPSMAQRMLEEFHESHPNIRVFYVPDPENLEDQMMAEMQNGTAADVFAGCCHYFPIWAQKGYALDLRPFVSADLDKETIQDWDPAQYNALFTRDGRQFGLPKYHGALALYYNKDAFDLRNLSYPDESWNYDTYAKAMRALTTLARQRNDPEPTTVRWGSMVDISWERLQVHVNSWGGHFVDPGDPRKCRLSEEPALKAIEWLRSRMWSDRTMASPLDLPKLSTRQAFVNERTAIVEDGSWALKDILSSAKFRVGVAPLPLGPARRATLATTDAFGIFAGTRHPEAAWELLKFLIGKEYGIAMAQAQFLQPARASLLPEWTRIVRDQFPRQAEELDLNVFAKGQTEGYSVTAEVFANMGDAQALATKAWEDIFTLNRDPATVLTQTCQEIEKSQGVVTIGGKCC